MPISLPVGKPALRWLALVVACATNGTSIAAPANGAAVGAGVIAAREGEMSSRGLSIGADAQFVFNERWSLNPTIMISAERESASRRISDGLAGVQLRRWVGDWFVGAHFFAHARAIIVDNTITRTNYGPAGGVVAGFEGTSGWGAALQIDAFENTNVQGTFRNAVRLHLTHRWR